MNNDKAYYESEEFWSTAPEGAEGYIPDNEDWYATFWKRGEDNSLWCQYEKPEQCTLGWHQRKDGHSVESLPFYIKRPWFVDGKCVALPPVGTELEWKELTGFKWVKAKVLFISETSVVLQRFDGFEWQMPTKRVVFRPHAPKERTMQEKMLDKWVAQGIDFAYDTPSSQVCIGSVFDFVVKNFKVEDKEEK